MESTVSGARSYVASSVKTTYSDREGWYGISVI